MTSFSNIARPVLSARQQRRIGRRDVIPAATKGRQIAQDLIKNGAVSDALLTMADGVVVTLTARFTSSIDENVRLASTPFMVALFDTSTLAGIDPENNQIPMQSGVGDFDVFGPFAMPNYLSGGKRYYENSAGSKIYFASDGNDAVHRITLGNNSGVLQDVIALVQLRTIQSIGA